MGYSDFERLCPGGNIAAQLYPHSPVELERWDWDDDDEEEEKR
jgi:hypothetical protein